MHNKKQRNRKSLTQSDTPANIQNNYIKLSGFILDATRLRHRGNFLNSENSFADFYDQPYSPLREKCSNTEFFLVRIFPHSDWIRRDAEYLSVFNPNAGKYGPEKTLYLDTFHAVHFFHFPCFNCRLNSAGNYFFSAKTEIYW